MHSIKQKIYLPVGSVILISALVSGYFMQHVSAQAIYKKSLDNANAMALMVIASAETNYDKALLQRQVSRMAADKAIKKVFIIDTKTHSIVISNKKVFLDQNFHSYLKESGQAEKFEMELKEQNFLIGDRVIFTRPIEWLQDNRLVEQMIYIELDYTQSLRANRQTTFMIISGFVVMLVLMIFVARLRLNQIIIDPIATFLEKHKDQKTLSEEDTGLDEVQNLLYMVQLAFYQDARHRQEIESERSFFKQLIDIAPIRVFWKDTQGIYRGVNKLFLEDAKLADESEVIGKTDFDMVWKEIAEDYRHDDFEIIEHDTKKINFIEQQVDDLGNKKVLSTSKIPIKNKKGEIVGVLGLYEDITQRVMQDEALKRQEEMLVFQSRYAAMGEMIGMIAHQWRQPLSVISIASTDALVSIELQRADDEKLKNIFNTIISQTSHLSETINDFRNFFKPDKEKTFQAPHEVFEQSINILGGSFAAHNIKIVKNYRTHRKIHLYARELLQVIINLMKNAQDAYAEALKENGTLVLETDEDIDFYYLIVCDQAGGIDDEIKDKVFDPYFSTKHERNGTGIGLYMVRTIIEKHFKGKITFENKEGGVCFKIAIPTDL